MRYATTRRRYTLFWSLKRALQTFAADTLSQLPRPKIPRRPSKQAHHVAVGHDGRTRAACNKPAAARIPRLLLPSTTKRPAPHACTDDATEHVAVVRLPRGARHDREPIITECVRERSRLARTPSTSALFGEKKNRKWTRPGHACLDDNSRLKVCSIQSDRRNCYRARRL